MSSTVLPSSCSERTVSHAWRRAAGSKPVVGSSRKTSSGSPTSASAKSSRRCWPPDSVTRALRRRRLQPAQRDRLLDVARRVVEPGPVADRLAHGQVPVEPARLQHDADPLAQRDRPRARVHAEHGDAPAAALAEALEDLHGRRLARPVGPEQAEDLAAPHAERDAAHGLVGPVGLAQILDLDRDVGRHRPHHGNLAATSMRCACIDIGSNTTRLLVADVADGRLAPARGAARVHADRAQDRRRGRDPRRR